MSSERPKFRLLMIDDDAELGRLLAEYFQKFGHQLDSATTAAQGRHLLRRDDPDLLILDVMLPDADGMDLCRSIRKDSDVPILMLTARGDVPDRVLGLEYGADDYVPKPFEPRELVARVESLMRRARETPRASLSAGGLELRTETRVVTLHGESVDLTSTEFDLLHALMESRGRVLSRDALLDRLQGGEADVLDRAVDMAVSRLRAKLDDDARTPRFIRTVRNVGYQFVVRT